MRLLQSVFGNSELATLLQPISFQAVKSLERRHDVCGIRLDLPFAHYAIEFFLLSMEVPGSPSFARYMTDLTVFRFCFEKIFATYLLKS